MNPEISKNPDESLEAALALLDAEERAYQNHWIWKKLRCRPEEFFRSFRKYADTLDVPQRQWTRAYQRAQDEIRIKALEKQHRVNPNNFTMLSALRA